MRPFPMILALLSLGGCAGGDDPQDTGSIALDCADGDVQELDCGLNDRGVQEQLCAAGVWEDDGACTDTDECVDADASAEDCWDGRGSVDLGCELGEWVPGDCTLAGPARIAGDADAADPLMSANGRFVAFESVATDFVGGDDNGQNDVFVHDLATQTTALVSMAMDGGVVTAPSTLGGISGDGRYVVFSSVASDLTALDTEGFQDVFLRDTFDGSTIRLSEDGTGVGGNADSYGPVISADGTTVAYYSPATNLVVGDDNGFMDVFVYELGSGSTTRVAINGGGAVSPKLSGDGRYMALHSDTTTARGGGPPYQAYLHDRVAGTTSLISKTPAGVAGVGSSGVTDVSDDGSAVAFQNSADDLLAADNNSVRDVLVWDRVGDSLQLATLTNTGSQTPRNSVNGAISADGNLVVFRSVRPYTDDADDSLYHVYLRDLNAQTTVVLDLTSAGARGNGHALDLDLAANGKHVAFGSRATDLVAGDTNGVMDIFVMPTGY